MPGVLYAIAAYFLLALVVTFPLVLSLDKAVSDPVDPILNTWIMAWEHHALLTRPLAFFDANIFYPHKQTLLYSETLLVPSLLLMALSTASGSPILAHNVLVLSGFVLTGTGGYLLGRWLFRHHWSGMALGGVMAFNSFTLSNIGQAQLLHLEWLPLALLYFGRLLHRPTARNALLIALFLALQFHTVIYYGLFGFVTITVVGTVLWLLKDYQGSAARWKALGYFMLSLLLTTLLCLPLGLAYYRLSQKFGFERTLADAWPFSASLEMWLTSPRNNVLYGEILGRELPKLGFYAVDALFPGALLILCAVMGLALWLGCALRGGGSGPSARWRAILWPLCLLAGIGFFFLLSLGPYPQQESLKPDFDRVLPYAWIHQAIPGFQALRAPVRFAAVVFMGLAVAAAYLVKLVRGRMLQFALFVLLMVDMLALPIDPLFTPVMTEEQRAAYMWLAQQPQSAYLELPVYAFGQAGEAAQWLESQFHSTIHWQATPVGYSGFFPHRYNELLIFVSEFPRQEVVAFLQALGVEWVILHRDRMGQEVLERIDSAIAQEQWKTQSWGDLLAIYLPSVEPRMPDQHFYIPTVAQADKAMTLAAIFISDAPLPIAPGTPVSDVRVEWWRGDKLIHIADVTQQPPFFVDRVALATFAIAVPEQAGEYTVRILGTEPGQMLASATVSVQIDVASPEVVPLPVRPLAVSIVCHEEKHAIEAVMQTVGWYDEAFTLSARLVNSTGEEVGRAAADVEFGVASPRSHLLYQGKYYLPVDTLPEVESGSMQVELIAYRWQQEAERIVPRHFVADDGAIVERLRLPLQGISSCATQ